MQRIHWRGTNQQMSTGCCELSEQENPKAQHQRFPAWSATTADQACGSEVWLRRSSIQNTPGAHSSESLLSQQKYTTLTWRQRTHLLNEFLPSTKCRSGVAHITWVLKNVLLWIMQSSHSRFKLDSGFKSDIQDFTRWCRRDERATSTNCWCYCFNVSIRVCSSVYQVWQTLTPKPRQWPAPARNNTWTTCNHWLMLMYRPDWGRTRWLKAWLYFSQRMLWLIWVRMVNQSPTHVTHLMTHFDESQPTTSHYAERRLLANPRREVQTLSLLHLSDWLVLGVKRNWNKTVHISCCICTRTLVRTCLQTVQSQPEVHFRPTYCSACHCIQSINSKSILEMSIPTVATLKYILVCWTVT